MVDPIAINADTGAPAYSAGEFRQGLALPLAFDGRPAGGRQGVRPGGTQLQVTLNGTDIKIAPGVCYIDPAWTSTQAGYWVPFPAELTRGPLQAADATNPRKDRVWARVWDDDEDTSGLRTADVEYQAGVAAATPTPPAIPQGAIPLALIDVPAQGGGSAVVVDEREYTAMAGGVLLVADGTERDALAAYAGLVVWRLDLGRLEVYDGAAWGKIAAGLSPGERIQTTIVTVDSSVFTTSETVVLSVTAALDNGRTYRVRAKPKFASDVDDDLIIARIREDDGSGTQLQNDYVRIRGAGSDVRGFECDMEAEYTAGSTGTKTFVVTADRLVGSGDIHLEASTAEPNYLYVDYIRG